MNFTPISLGKGYLTFEEYLDMFCHNSEFKLPIDPQVKAEVLRLNQEASQQEATAREAPGALGVLVADLVGDDDGDVGRHGDVHAAAEGRRAREEAEVATFRTRWAPRK